MKELSTADRQAAKMIRGTTFSNVRWAVGFQRLILQAFGQLHTKQKLARASFFNIRIRKGFSVPKRKVVALKLCVYSVGWKSSFCSRCFGLCFLPCSSVLYSFRFPHSCFWVDREQTRTRCLGQQHRPPHTCATLPTLPYSTHFTLTLIY